MTSPARGNRTLRRPLAVASVLALTSGLAMGFAPAAGAAGNGGNGGNGTFGGGIQSTRPTAPTGAFRWGGNGGDGGAGATGPIECTDANLDRLARATGGEVHTLEADAHCLVVHRFATSDTFTITARVPFPLETLVVGGGAGGGGGSGWEDRLKAAGAEPDAGGGAGGAGGDVLGGTVDINASTGAFTYTPKDVGSDGHYSYTPGDVESTGSPSFTDPAGRTLSVPVTVGAGGAGGAPGTSTAGSTVGGQGGSGGDSSFGEFVAYGGSGGFGGRGAEGSESGVQAGWSPSPRTGGRKGGSNSNFWGGDLGVIPVIDYAAPGGAGASENGHLPIEVGTTGNGGNGGAGVAAIHFSDGMLKLGDGGGGGTISPASPPYAPVVGGAGGNGGRAGLLSVGGAGGAGGDGQDAPDGFGGGGGGGGTDGSVTPGDSNAGRGGDGGAGVVYVRYLAAAAPVAPPAPTVVAGDGSVTLSFERFDDAADYYMLWVAGDPTKTCTITPPATSCVIDGLTNGENYQFLAYSGNAAGESDTSTASVTVAPGTGTLPYTGNNTRGLASLALTMIGLGGATTALTRRRRTIS